jgi:uncharacterized protein YutE (UPF0331/DUF86 family)
VIYDVNVGRIVEQLNHLETCQMLLEQVRMGEGLCERFAAERALHLAAECMVDVGSVMIDGFIMRDPGGYLDIVDILEDEKVIDAGVAGRLRELIAVRERLVRHYTEITWEEIFPHLQDVDWYQEFANQVKTYLKRELEKWGSARGL